MILCDRDPTIPKTTFSIESEIQVKVEESLLMPAVFHTVASRTQLALVISFFKNWLFRQSDLRNLFGMTCLNIFMSFYFSRKCLKLPTNLAPFVNVWFMMNTSSTKVGLLLWQIWTTALCLIRSCSLNLTHRTQIINMTWKKLSSNLQGRYCHLENDFSITQ